MRCVNYRVEIDPIEAWYAVRGTDGSIRTFQDWDDARTAADRLNRPNSDLFEERKANG